MRLFFAVPLEGKALAAAKAAQTRLRELSQGARLSWANPLQLHFTLAFLGDQEESILLRAREAGRVACAGASAFPMALGAASAFPRPERPRVLWIGASEGEHDLALLASRLRAQLGRREVPFDGKPFRAHATLARVEPASILAAAAALSRLAPVGHEGQIVTSFALFESKAGAHRVVERFALPLLSP